MEAASSGHARHLRPARNRALLRWAPAFLSGGFGRVEGRPSLGHVAVTAHEVPAADRAATVPVKGKTRCRLHGGRSGPPIGSQNGLSTGQYTRAAIAFAEDRRSSSRGRPQSPSAVSSRRAATQPKTNG
jgi:hypothetical protein